MVAATTSRSAISALQASSRSTAVASTSRLPTVLPRSSPSFVPAFNFSTSSSSNNASSSNGSTSTTSSTLSSGTTDLNHLTWDKYLQLRRSRRLAGMVTTIPTTLLAGAAAGSYFLTLEIDPANSIGGIDPIYINAGLTLAFTGLGWLTGPTIGNSIWSLLHRKNAQQIAQKDHDFYEHIKKNRVDPTRQSMQNPVPDYYGEKIGSIKQYRQWLRDQAAYRRKAAHGLEEDA